MVRVSFVIFKLVDHFLVHLLICVTSGLSNAKLRLGSSGFELVNVNQCLK